jgi:UPF0271 protein
MTINCDLGEGIENEHLLLDYIDRTSIACGGHVGNNETVLKSLQAAQIKNVACGAHPSYPDKEHFGRKPLNISRTKLQDSLCFQLDLFLESSQKLSIKMDHVKAHGALYNGMMSDLRIGEVFIKAVNKMDVSCPIFALYDSDFYHEFHKDFDMLQEGFIDRKYTVEKRLTPRSLEGALITDVAESIRQFKAFAAGDAIETLTGESVQIKADTVCIHGDNPAALAILKVIKGGTS